MNKKGQLVINQLFNAFTSDIQLLPKLYQQLISEDYQKERVICDYIAGMTDNYAIQEYQTIYE
jgi:dGTP triphosphohydrolase